MKKIMESIRKTTGLFGVIILLAISVSCQNFFWSHTGGEIAEPPQIAGCIELGYLYNWYVIGDSRNLTSNDDWRAPTYSDFRTNLYNYTAPNSGVQLKEEGFTYWDDSGVSDKYGIDTYGFSARGAGYRNTVTNTFVSLNQYANFWGENRDASTGWSYNLKYNSEAMVTQAQDKKFGLSIRLVSDATGIPDGTTTIYEGNDGKFYNAVAINGLYWLSENLAETEYRNGDPIPTVEDATTWAGLLTGAKCAYDNDYTNVGCDEQGDSLITYPTIEYGLLYNQYTVLDSRKISSSDDWVVPFVQTNFYNYISGDGGSLKKTGYTYWDSPNTGATNEYLFNAVGAGNRETTGVFSKQNQFMGWWESRSGGAAGWVVYNDSSFYVYHGSISYTRNPKEGISVRLTKTAVGVPDGTTTTYTGNDGKVYLAVAINGLYWLAENLAETKYRNGDIIPEVTDNTEWSNLTTGATCAYDNNWIYVGRPKPAYY